MKRNLNEAIGSLVLVEDGVIGKVADFYFDDHKWTVRYVVIETGRLLNRHKVLLSPQAFKKIDWDAKEFSTNLTEEQVRNSPDIDTDKTVSRQQRLALHSYYKWPVEWGEGHERVVVGPVSGGALPIFVKLDQEGRRVSSYILKGDPHLQSFMDVSGYDAQAEYHEKIGHLESFYMDENTWIISYMLINSHKLNSGNKILISPYWVSEVSWDDSKIFVDLTIEAIKNCPEFDYSKSIGIDYEAKLCQYYISTEDQH